MYKLNSNLIGKAVPEIVHELTWRKITNYAAGLEDLNPLYMDDKNTEGIVAHPLYPVAATWPVIQAMPEFLSDVVPFEVFSKMVHFTEHLELRRLIKGSDKLSINGQVVAVIPGKSGTIVVTRLDACDLKGEPVFTEHIGGMFRGVECEDEGGGIDDIPQMFAKCQTQTPSWSHEVEISSNLPYVYDACSNIVFPIHTSPAFAQMVGLPGIILQGTCTLALAVKELVNTELNGDPRLIKSIGCNFGAMVLPGSNIKIELLENHQEEPGRRLCFQVLNQKGEVAIKNGFLLL